MTGTGLRLCGSRPMRGVVSRGRLAPGWFDLGDAAWPPNGINLDKFLFFALALPNALIFPSYFISGGIKKRGCITVPDLRY